MGRVLQPVEHPIDLAGHNKIVLVQPLNLLGAQRDGRVTPPEAYVRMVPLDFSQLAAKLSAARKLLKWNVRSMRWSSSRSSQFEVCDRKCSASASVSRGSPPRQGVHFFSASVSIMS